VAFGEDSFVVAPTGASPVLLSAWDQAKECCRQIASAEDGFWQFLKAVSVKRR
jgi:hypothetical protein